VKGTVSPSVVLAWAVTLGVTTGATWAAAAKSPPTIKDLDDSQVVVSDAPPQNVDANKAMDSYRRFLDLNAGDAGLRAEALRRLGDLNLESSESERIERELVTNEGLRATEAIHLYSALLKTYPKYDRNDAVLYQLARAYELNGQSDEALAALNRLVAEYPNSRYIDEAQFRRGEILFAPKTYAAAQAAYEAVVQIGPSSPFYNQSLYKHGWSLFKQGENERSLESFAGVLDSVLISKRDPTALVEIDSLSRANRELVEDTFRVMAITFSYLDGPKSIDDFVKHHPRPYAYLLYARLGDLYAEKERYTDAADAYRAFVLQDPDNEKAPQLQMQAIEAYAKGGFPQLVLQGKKEFVENYGYGTAYWQGRTPQGEPVVVSELATNLKDLATYSMHRPSATRAPRTIRRPPNGIAATSLTFPKSPIRPRPISCWPRPYLRTRSILRPHRNTKRPPTTTARTTRRVRPVMPPSSPTARKKIRWRPMARIGRRRPRCMHRASTARCDSRKPFRSTRRPRKC